MHNDDPHDDALAAHDAFARGLERLAAGDPAAAVDAFSAALAHAPDFARAFACRGDAYADLDALDLALADYDAALTLKQQDADVLFARACLHTRRGDYDAAIGDYSAAIRLQPDDDASHSNRAECCFACGRIADALAGFRRALTLAGESTFARVGLALAQHALGDVEAARAHWRVLLAQDARHRDAGWVRAHYRLQDALADEARRLTASL